MKIPGGKLFRKLLKWLVTKGLEEADKELAKQRHASPDAVTERSQRLPPTDPY